MLSVCLSQSISLTEERELHSVLFFGAFMTVKLLHVLHLIFLIVLKLLPLIFPGLSQCNQGKLIHIGGFDSDSLMISKWTWTCTCQARCFYSRSSMDCSVKSEFTTKTYRACVQNIHMNLSNRFIIIYLLSVRCVFLHLHMCVFHFIWLFRSILTEKAMIQAGFVPGGDWSHQ